MRIRQTHESSIPGKSRLTVDKIGTFGGCSQFTEENNHALDDFRCARNFVASRL
jgi:hypothetical protein